MCLTIVATVFGWAPDSARYGAVLQAAEKDRADETPAFFRSARPVWPRGRETEMNLTVGFRTSIAAPIQGQTIIRVAAASIYRLTINGHFVGSGPARGPHGFYRVDQWDLTDHLRDGQNTLAIEVAGYNVNSYYLLDQPSFLQAEVTSGKRVVASTAGDGRLFQAVLPDHRVQKVQRYSFQRPFIEVYRLAPGWNAWQLEGRPALPAVELAVQPSKRLLARHVLYPSFTMRRPIASGLHGTMQHRPAPARIWRDRSLTNIGPELKGYREQELSVVPTVEAQHYASGPAAGAWHSPERQTTLPLASGEYQLFDLGTNLTGYLGARLVCRRDTRLWMMFDEILSDDRDVNWRRLGCCNIIEYRLQPGEYNVESIEPYTARYLKLFCVEGDCSVGNVFLREYAHPEITQATFDAGDQRLNKLYQAGVQTFRQNSLDLFMDCPSRERAGWLCDSYFTARVEYDLEPAARVEHNFIQNFLLPGKFAHLPDGMLPMCYPADHYNGNFIPNWAMWFVVQLEEYAARSADRATVEALRPKVLKLIEYFRGFENSDGLLERLDKWVFVEWSAANRFVQDVSYPTNMLYAGMLDAASRLYQLPELGRQADRIRQVIRKQSFDGEFFVDNATRQQGQLKVSRNRTEVCQYFAFFFRVATPATHQQLWQRLVKDFGPDRSKTKAFAEVHPANSFIGNMLRMELLSRAGLNQQILDESIAYLLYMSDRTGTLWEHTGPQASCDHGFASHIVNTLYRDVLGLYQVDKSHKVVTVRFGDLTLDRCRGAIPTPQGLVRLAWQKQGETIRYSLQVPQGYRTVIENLTQRTLTPESSSGH